MAAGRRVAALIFASALAALPAMSGAEERAGADADEEEHDIETENLFGFTTGSDNNEAGERNVSATLQGNFGKRFGSYAAIAEELEFEIGATDDLSVSVGLLGAYHRIRNVPDFDDIGGRNAFAGFFSEIRWRLIDREKGPFGLTLQFEPSLSRIDEGSGSAGRFIGSENKLIIDKELVPEKLFGAVNFLYEIERGRERGEREIERESEVGVAAALSYRIAPDFFLGGEARYLRAYEGFDLGRFSGQALFLGPTAYWRVGKGYLSLAWSAQVAGREAFAHEAEGDDEPAIVRRSRLDLTNFERHGVQLKAGFEF